ncbi:hypothetical protein [Brumimicrobium aurantiacum]|uniref:DUF4270 family protein n=1 Tax=Brumimicrobium aurantiacum TaxID=1737063 RepID=A0A3E1F268_9FLAO|nr:hypothetical protein [Brumimicrobium aurantiacum]RFC55890.1 hypothetical protein DXU93_02840 [Brumimicrobium aurantiacum]
MKRFTFISTVSFLTLLVLSTACKKNNLDKIASGAWNPNLAVPLAHSNFNVYDIFARDDSTDLVVIDENSGAIALAYEGEILSFNAESILSIQDLNGSTDLSIADLNAPPIPTFNGSVTANNTQNFDFDAGMAEIHEVNFKSGVLMINASTDLRHSVICEITFPDLQINGVPVSTTLNFNYNGTVPQTATATIDFNGVEGDFTMGNTTVNELEAEISTTINGSGEAINGNEELNIAYAFEDLKFENATGYFGQFNLGIPGDSVLLKLYQNASNGYFELVNPKIKFDAFNSFGFPIRIDLSNLKTVDINTGDEYPLTGFPSTFDITAAPAIGQEALSTFELTTSNTNNLSNLVSSVPKYFVYSSNVQSNPNGNVPPLNFVSDTSQLKINTEVLLPLEGSAYGFALQDTFDFNFNEDVEALESVMFRLNINNGFPIKLTSNVVFLDENYTPLFNLFNTPQDVISPALTDNNGHVNENVTKITDAYLSETQILQLSSAKYILVGGVAETLNGQSGEVVKLFDSYNLDLKLGLQVEGNVQF